MPRAVCCDVKLLELLEYAHTKLYVEAPLASLLITLSATVSPVSSARFTSMVVPSKELERMFDEPPSVRSDTGAAPVVL